MKKLIALTVFMSFLFAAFAAANPLITNTQTTFTVNEGKLLTIPLTITAPDSGTANLSKNVSFGSLSKTQIIGTSESFTWTPGFTDAGVHHINFSVNDSDSSNYTLFVVTVNNVPASLNAPALSLGSGSQERSNPLHDDKDKRELNLSGTIVLTNNGGEAITSLTASFSPSGKYVADKTKINLTIDTPSSLAIGATTTAHIIIRVPENLDAVDSLLKEAAIDVGTITFSGTAGSAAVSTTSQVTLRAENQLEIDDADVLVTTASGEENKDNLRDGDRVKDLKPEDKVRVEIRLENKFSEKEDVRIEDIDVTLEIDDLDVDEEESIGDLRANDKDTIVLEFDIDEDADDGTYDGVLTVKGTDENGAVHGARWTLTFDVERKTHEIAIRSLSLSPSTVRCEEHAELSVSVRNIGQRDEDEVGVHLESPDLNYGDVQNFIQLDEGDSTTKRFTIPIADTLRTGTYRLSVSTYYNTGSLSNRETVLLTKAACVESETPTLPQDTTQQQPPLVVVQKPETPPAVTGDTVVADTPPTSAEQPFTQTSGYLALLGLLYLAVIVGGIYVVTKAMKKQ